MPKDKTHYIMAYFPRKNYDGFETEDPTINWAPIWRVVNGKDLADTIAEALKVRFAEKYTDVTIDVAPGKQYTEVTRLWVDADLSLMYDNRDASPAWGIVGEWFSGHFAFEMAKYAIRLHEAYLAGGELASGAAGAPESMSTAEASIIIGRDKGHICHLCAEGKLRAVKDPRGEWRIERAVAELYAKGHAKEQARTPRTEARGCQTAPKAWYCAYCDGEDVQAIEKPAFPCVKCGKSQWLRRSPPAHHQ